MKQNQKSFIKTKKVIDRGKRSKRLTEVKRVENISKNPQSFPETRPKGSLSVTQTIRPCICATESFQIKRRYPLTEKLPGLIELFKFVSHRIRMSGEFDSRKDSHSPKFELKP